MLLPSHQMAELSRRAHKLAQVDADIATKRSEEDEARVDGMLGAFEEFDKSDLYQQRQLLVENYLFLAGLYPISVELMSQVYNYAFDEACCWEKDPNQVYNHSIFFNDVFDSVKESLTDLSLLENYQTRIIDKDRNERRKHGDPVPSITESLARFAFNRPRSTAYREEDILASEVASPSKNNSIKQSI
tara:strand:- start:1034 stop:1597 length:564 start_codon:yes stop_codon:yes gene_type:complete